MDSTNHHGSHDHACACSAHGHDETDYHKVPPPEFAERSVTVPYIHAPSVATGGDDTLLATVLKNTPTPKGRSEFSSVHLVAPPAGLSAVADGVTISCEAAAEAMGKPLVMHRLPGTMSKQETDAMEEYNAIFETASQLILTKADRASLLVFVGWEDVSKDAIAAFIGMLPFRGIQAALLTQRKEHGNLLRFETRSGVFEVDARDAGRMGMFPVKAVFGALEAAEQTVRVSKWQPIQYDCEMYGDSVRLPFKIGGLELPMITHNGSYDDALAAIADTVTNDYAAQGGFYPIVSCGETCDALGYGSDLLAHLDESGFYFNHRSGETFKRHQEYGSAKLFQSIAEARAAGLKPLIFAVGGGVNGNCSGLIAAITGADFVEVPTTPMHYNDATTSAKKAFSLVVDDVILSKNILGAFYLPRFVFCVSEMLLTSSSANIHATVGESTKTMNMLGVANSRVGATDYHNILGAREFASDYTKIVKTVGGFDELIAFIESPEVKDAKAAVIELGQEIAALRKRGATIPRRVRRRYTSDMSVDSGRASTLSRSRRASDSVDDGADSPDYSASASSGANSSSGEASDDDCEPRTVTSVVEQYAKMAGIVSKRRRMMEDLRALFKRLPNETQASIKEFLTVVNKEIVSAKAMFLAYSDPFEKYRALLFEYAHTLGHGVEAFANKLYQQCRVSGVDVPEEAFRLHGQCVGMAVLWAGQMSANLGVLEGHGLSLHQSLVYLFNRHSGFSFGPLRRLCDRMGVSKDEFCEGVLRVVRRDNKRGYCASTDPRKSVDQLVAHRPGKMLRSDDSNAELRYLVEVDEEWQRDVLGRAFDGEFDRVADLRDGRLVFVPGADHCAAESHEVGRHIHGAIAQLYA